MYLVPLIPQPLQKTIRLVIVSASPGQAFACLRGVRFLRKRRKHCFFAVKLIWYLTNTKAVVFKPSEKYMIIYNNSSKWVHLLQDFFLRPI